jgi:hypothetical protein
VMRLVIVKMGLKSFAILPLRGDGRRHSILDAGY